MSAPINVESLFSVKGLVALVTGGGTGIGLMIAKALADGGAARVYILGRRTEVLQSAAKTIGKPDVVVPLQCDVTSKASLEAACAAVEKDVGFLNLVVCNAGVGGQNVPPPAPGSSLDEWRDRELAADADAFLNTFRVNTVSAWFTAITCLKLLDAGNKRGNLPQSSQVVVTGSIAGFNKLATGGWAYGQSKAAVMHLVKQLSAVLPTWNIRVNCIAPGLFPSQMSEGIVAAAGGSLSAPGDVIAIAKSAVPLERMGDVQDMAGQILYLASRAGAYLNGNLIIVDGGRLTTFPSTF